MQLVDNQFGVFPWEPRYAIGVVLAELSYLPHLNLTVAVIIRFELLQQAVALVLHQFSALVDGEVEGGGEVGVSPWLALLYLEVGFFIARHGPHNQSNGADHH